MYIILGTAGHIDHGKTALVKALTGIDTDRLKEEKERGITIDLGFADLCYPDGIVVGIIDVPGHEKLVKNMLAGVGGIDIVLLVIAADEGVMPQTKEHLAICNLLGISSGIIVITKTDLVDNEWLEIVIDDVKNFVKDSFLEKAEIVTVSSKTGENISLLKKKIHDLAIKVKQKSSGGAFRLPIDRVFTLKGFGTIVTGTALSGKISINSEIQILPVNITTKVRGLQNHGKPIKTAVAGQRVAINLQSVQKDDIKRGDVVVTPGVFRCSRLLDVKLNLLKDAPELKNNSFVHFHITTSEAIGRVIFYDTEKLKPTESCYAQIRLDRDIIAVSGDRFVIRRFSPVITIGGGVVLDPYSKKRKKKEGISALKIYETASLSEKISMKLSLLGLKGMTFKSIIGWSGDEIKKIEDAIKYLKDSKLILQYEDKFIHKKVFDSIEYMLVDTLKKFHKNNPLKFGMQKEVLRSLFGLSPAVFEEIILISEKIVSDKETVRLKDFKITVTDTYNQIKEKILKLLKDREYKPLAKKEISEYFGIKIKEMEDILKLMVNEKLLIRINDNYYLTTEDYKRLLFLLKEFFNKKETMSVSEFRDLLGTTRKYALPFLEYLDSNKITLRVGDIRKKHPSF